MRYLLTIPSVLLASVLFGMCFVQAEHFTQQIEPVALPAGTLTAGQVLTLFSGKTVSSVTAVRKRVSLSYYDPGGEVRQSRKGTKRFGRWRVTEHGRICLQMEQLREKCRIIVMENGEYKKYIVKKNGNHQHTVTYPHFWDGNPFGL